MTKVIHGIEWEIISRPMEFDTYKSKHLSFKLGYSISRHDYHVSCYAVGVDDWLINSRNLEHAELKAVRSIIFKINDNFKKWNRLNESIDGYKIKSFY